MATMHEFDADPGIVLGESRPTTSGLPCWVVYVDGRDVGIIYATPKSVSGWAYSGRSWDGDQFNTDSLTTGTRLLAAMWRAYDY